MIRLPGLGNESGGNEMKRLFGNIKMNWLRVILFAVAAGVYTGLVMLIPMLENTSFQDIGISYEWWVVFAVIVVVNCKKPVDAMLKCFVFFLISQPLVYLTQILCGAMSIENGIYYFRLWLPLIILTLPGGLIAYFCKKQNILGAVILALGNTVQAFLCVYYFERAIQHFPCHLLSSLFCAASIVIMSLCIQKKRINRLIAMLLPLVLTAGILVLVKMTGRVLF